MLYTLHLELTNRCSMRCPICFRGDSVSAEICSDSAPSTDMDPDFLRDLLLEAKELHVKQILFSGGEPLLYPHLSAGLRLASSLGFYTNLATSGIGLDSHKASALKESGLTVCTVSIAGSTEAIHNRYRSGYRIALNAMDELRSIGLPFEINWVAFSGCIEDFPSVCSLAREKGARAVNVLMETPSPNGWFEHPLTLSEIRQLSEYIKQENEFARTETCFLPLARLLKQPYGCIAGEYEISVRYNRTFTLCTHRNDLGKEFTSLTSAISDSQNLKNHLGMETRRRLHCSSCVNDASCDPCCLTRNCPLCKKRKLSFAGGIPCH